jgi:DNA repair photolyase
MPMEKEIGLTREFLKILNYYKYPFFIVTKSPLVGSDEYLELLDPKLAAVHMSIPSAKDKYLKLIEPKAPSAKSRLTTLKRLRGAGVWTTARMNPLFPCFADGHFSKRGGELTDTPELEIFGTDLLHAIEETGTKSILSGFLSLEKKHFNLVDPSLQKRISKMTEENSMSTGFSYSGKEVQAYYSKIQTYCHQLGLNHTTCYLGSSEENYQIYKKFNDNDQDCCDVIGKVEAHKTDTVGFSGFDLNYRDGEEEKLGFLSKLAKKMTTYLFNQLSSKDEK